MIIEKPKNGELYQVKNLAGQWVNARYVEKEGFAQWELEAGGFLYVFDVKEWRLMGNGGVEEE